MSFTERGSTIIISLYPTEGESEVMELSLLPLPVSLPLQSQVALLFGKGGCSLAQSEADTWLYFANLSMEPAWDRGLAGV